MRSIIYFFIDRDPVTVLVSRHPRFDQGVSYMANGRTPAFNDLTKQLQIHIELFSSSR